MESVNEAMIPPSKTGITFKTLPDKTKSDEENKAEEKSLHFPFNYFDHDDVSSESCLRAISEDAEFTLHAKFIDLPVLKRIVEYYEVKTRHGLPTIRKLPKPLRTSETLKTLVRFDHRKGPKTETGYEQLYLSPDLEYYAHSWISQTPLKEIVVMLLFADFVGLQDIVFLAIYYLVTTARSGNPAKLKDFFGVDVKDCTEDDKHECEEFLHKDLGIKKIKKRTADEISSDSDSMISNS